MLKATKERYWINTEMEKADAMLFCACLIIEGIHYLKSSAGNLVHLEIFVNDKEKTTCERYLVAMQNGN